MKLLALRSGAVMCEAVEVEPAGKNILNFIFEHLKLGQHAACIRV